MVKNWENKITIIIQYNIAEHVIQVVQLNCLENLNVKKKIKMIIKKF
jgi:hypothetical protein